MTVNATTDAKITGIKAVLGSPVMTVDSERSMVGESTLIPTFPPTGMVPFKPPERGRFRLQGVAIGVTTGSRADHGQIHFSESL